MHPHPSTLPLPTPPLSKGVDARADGGLSCALTCPPPVETFAPPRPAPAPPAPRAAVRADALDALRGFAILMMVLSGIIPFGVLPAWMYHAQVPPPAHAFVPTLAGITWVDLVFPFFLFALGAAIPLAGLARLERGAAPGALVRGALARGGLLLFFAVFTAHVRPWAFDGGHEYTLPNAAGPWLVALAGFACLWAVFWRAPLGWPRAWRTSVRAAGWAGALVILALVRYPDGSGFRVSRYDIILVVLANMAAVGGGLWIGTRARPFARWGALVLLAAAILGGREPGWMQPVMDWKPVEGLFRPYYLKYLFLVIPGTFAGERLWAWLRDASGDTPAWARSHPAALALLGVALQAVVVVGLFARAVPLTAALAGALLAAGWALTARPGDADERLAAWLWRSGAFWLVLGFVAEPFEGGIKKDNSTFSYYFVTAGLAHALLAALFVLGRRFGARARVVEANGQNPMLAYVAFHNLVLPLLTLTGAAAAISAATEAPWVGFGRGAAYTALTAVVVWVATRRGWVWRS